MERTQRLIALALCEAAIFAVGCWVGVMYPDAPHWVWLFIAVVSLLLAYIIWPKEVRMKLKLSSQYQNQPSIMQELLADIFPKKMRGGLSGLIFMFVFMFVLMAFPVFVQGLGLIKAYLQYLGTQFP